MRYLLYTLALFTIPLFSAHASTIQEIKDGMYGEVGNVSGYYTNPIVLTHSGNNTGRYFKFVLDATGITPTQTGQCYPEDGTQYTETYNVETLYAIDIYLYPDLNECMYGYPDDAINATIFDGYVSPVSEIENVIAKGDLVNRATIGKSLDNNVEFVGDNFIKVFLGSALAVLLATKYWIVILIIMATIIFSFRHRIFGNSEIKKHNTVKKEKPKTKIKPKK